MTSCELHPVKSSLSTVFSYDRLEAYATWSCFHTETGLDSSWPGSAIQCVLLTEKILEECH